MSELTPPPPNPGDSLNNPRRKKSFVASKLGCSYCKKQSRRKCDETLPECLACVKRGIRCSYLDEDQDFLDRIARAHSIAADLERHLLRQSQNSPAASFGRFRVLKSGTSTTRKVNFNKNQLTEDDGFIVFSSNPSTSRKPSKDFSKPKKHKKQTLSKAEGKAKRTPSPYPGLPLRTTLNDDAELEDIKFKLYEHTINKVDTENFGNSSKAYNEIFGDSFDFRHKRQKLFFYGIGSLVLNSQHSSVLFSSIICFCACMFQRHDLLYPDAPKLYKNLDNLIDIHYSHSATYINKQFQKILEISSKEKELNGNDIICLSKLVYNVSMSSMIQFGSVGFYRKLSYRAAMNYFVHYQEAANMYRKATKTFETKTGALGDGFAFFKALSYADMKEVFIPPYKKDFIHELFDEFFRFKRLIDYDPYMVSQFEQLAKFSAFLNDEIFPTAQENYVLHYPADVINKTQNFWYKIIPGEVVLLNDNKNLNIIQKVFYAYWATFCIALESIINHGAYCYGVGFFGFAKVVEPFEHTMFEELNNNLCPQFEELRGHVVYLLRIISFFSTRSRIYYEGMHFRNPFPDFLEEGFNRFRKRSLPFIKEDGITSFKNQYIRRENFPSVSYNSSYIQSGNTLFDQYQVQFKETVHPINTRISSIIHDDEGPTPINFKKYSVTSHGLLPEDFNPISLNNRSIDKKSLIIPVKDLNIYIHRYLSRLLTDRSILLSVTVLDVPENIPLYFDNIMHHLNHGLVPNEYESSLSGIRINDTANDMSVDGFNLLAAEYQQTQSQPPQPTSYMVNIPNPEDYNAYQNQNQLNILNSMAYQNQFISQNNSSQNHQWNAFTLDINGNPIPNTMGFPLNGMFSPPGASQPPSSDQPPPPGASRW